MCFVCVCFVFVCACCVVLQSFRGVKATGQLLFDLLGEEIAMRFFKMEQKVEADTKNTQAEKDKKEQAANAISEKTRNKVTHTTAPQRSNTTSRAVLVCGCVCVCVSALCGGC